MSGFVAGGAWSLRLGFLGVAVTGLVLDQLTKWWVLVELAPGGPIRVIPGFFTLSFHRNPGGAFGLFRNLDDGARNIIFLLVPLIIVGVIVVWSLRMATRPLWPQIALALILGGALGNMLDRLRFGYVVDFLYFHWRDTGYSWPAFNVADSLICTGVAMLILHIFTEDSAATEEA